LGLRHFFVTDKQKREYLSRASQRARGATKNKVRRPYKQYIVQNSFRYNNLPSEPTIIGAFYTHHYSRVLS